MVELADSRYDSVRRMSYVALDVPSWEDAEKLVQKFGDAVDGYKVGLELFHAGGPAVVERLCRLGKRVFLDVKLHDIPNTVRGALRSICQLPVEMVNVHALGGAHMMERAREAVDGAPYQPLLIAVTILTSLHQDALSQMGFSRTVSEVVEGLAAEVRTAGLDGVVASALEIAAIRRLVRNSGTGLESFEIVVPGTRPKGSGHQDQVRTLTPGEAVARGATRLVLGRTVTEAEDSEAALRAIWDEMLLAMQ